jgi:predicted AAA+ superfamily ATPase
MAYRRRLLAETLRRAMRSFPAALVTGARQCGKTTLLREEHGASHRYVSLERPDLRARAREDPEGFFTANPPPLILDEVQYAPELLHYVKDRLDSRREPGSWLLSGSQSFPLMRGVSQTLAGRVAVLQLDPLAVEELSPQRPAADPSQLLERVFGSRQRDGDDAPAGGATIPDLADWLQRGGYPEPRLSPAVDRRLWFSSYVQTYLERDVRDLVQVADLDRFATFLRLVAARTATLLNMSDLGRDAGVTGPTVRRWLSVLETSGIVYLLRPHHRSFGKRLVKSPKLYFVDPGLAAFLVGLHEREAMLAGPSAGALAETAVVSEWVKAFRARGEEPPLSFWASSRGFEVDLVIERDGRLHALEVKATATPTPDHATQIARWLELAGAGSRAALACAVTAPTALRPGIRAVPWHLAW